MARTTAYSWEKAADRDGGSPWKWLGYGSLNFLAENLYAAAADAFAERGINVSNSAGKAVASTTLSFGNSASKFVQNGRNGGSAYDLSGMQKGNTDINVLRTMLERSEGRTIKNCKFSFHIQLGDMPGTRTTLEVTFEVDNTKPGTTDFVMDADGLADTVAKVAAWRGMVDETLDGFPATTYTSDVIDALLPGILGGNYGWGKTVIRNISKFTERTFPSTAAEDAIATDESGLPTYIGHQCGNGITLAYENRKLHAFKKTVGLIYGHTEEFPNTDVAGLLDALRGAIASSWRYIVWRGAEMSQKDGGDCKKARKILEL